MKRTWRRRNFFIKKELQGRYIFIFFVVVIAGGFFFTAIFSLLSADTLTIVYEDNNLHLGKTPVILLKEILRANWLFIVAGGLMVVLAAMFMTHRFAGPVYRFEKTLEEMIAGNFNVVVRLRSKDEAKELAQKINTFNTALSSSLGEIRQISDQLDTHLSNAHAAGTENGDELNKAIELSGRLRDRLYRFKLKTDV